MRRTRAAGGNAARMLRGGGASRSLAEKRPDEALRGWSGRAVFFAGGSPGLRAVRREGNGPWRTGRASSVFSASGRIAWRPGPGGAASGPLTCLQVQSQAS